MEILSDVLDWLVFAVIALLGTAAFVVAICAVWVIFMEKFMRGLSSVSEVVSEYLREWWAR